MFCSRTTGTMLCRAMLFHSFVFRGCMGLGNRSRRSQVWRRSWLVTCPVLSIREGPQGTHFELGQLLALPCAPHTVFIFVRGPQQLMLSTGSSKSCLRQCACRSLGSSRRGSPGSGGRMWLAHGTWHFQSSTIFVQLQGSAGQRVLAHLR